METEEQIFDGQTGLPAWASQLPHDIRQYASGYRTIGDFVRVASEWEKRLELYPTSTEAEFNKVISKVKKVPPTAEAYETVSDYEYEKTLKKEAFEKKLSQSEYKTLVKAKHEAKEQRSANVKQMLSELGLKDEDLNNVKQQIIENYKKIEDKKGVDVSNAITDEMAILQLQLQNTSGNPAVQPQGETGVSNKHALNLSSGAGQPSENLKPKSGSDIAGYARTLLGKQKSA